MDLDKKYFTEKKHLKYLKNKKEKNDPEEMELRWGGSTSTIARTVLAIAYKQCVRCLAKPYS